MRFHQLLATAVTLENFTAGELAAVSNVPISAVRAELLRKPDWFSVISDDRPEERGPGRPANRYCLTDLQAARRELAEVRSRVSVPAPDARPAPSPASVDPEGDGPQLTVELAESMLLRALRSDEPGDKRVLATSSIAAADRALELLDEQGDDASEELTNRAKAVRGFATSVGDGEDGDPAHLRQAALHALDAYAYIPGLGPELILGALMGMSRAAGAAPPIAVVTGLDQEPGDLQGLGSADEWHSEPSVDVVVWFPQWAGALASRCFLAGAVIHNSNDADVVEQIEAIGAWHLPTVVARMPKTHESWMTIARHGATALPDADAEVLYSWFSARLADHTAPVRAFEPGGPPAATLSGGAEAVGYFDVA